MKVSSFYAVLCIAFIFSSCNSGENKTTETTADTAAAATTTEPAAVNTIVTSPQNMFMIRHKVKNFTAWLPVYDAHDSVRLKYGVHSYVLGRGLTDSNMVMIATKIDDIEKAKAFSKDPGLKEAMQKGGVTGTPVVQITTAEWQDTANIGALPRVLTEFAVKDWDVWKTKFAEHRQERADNGIVDRLVGHDAADNHKVILVTALTDTAKAFAFWKSDLIKKRREEGGVTGEPKRFIFTIAKRY